MLRVFLILLAILLAVLAFVFDRPWLYAGAGAPLLGALGMIGWQMWTRYQSHQRREPARPATDGAAEDDLEEFGIMDVRPQEEGSSTGATAASDETSMASERAPNTTPEPAPDPRTTTPTSNPAPPVPDPSALSSSGGEEPAPDPAPEPAGAPSTDESPLDAEPEASRGLQPLLESARAAMGAHSVCLLVQEDVTLEYRIEACASITPEVRTSGTFETQTPLLSATMSRQPVTVQALDEATREALGYYEARPAGLTQMAVAPVQRPDAPETIFLLADATDETDLAMRRTRRLLEHYAETVDLLLTDDSPFLGAGEQSATPAEDVSSEPEEESVSSGTEEDPRPRRTIIEEEMEAAQAATEDLALALVHLNRAESIARRGEEAVSTTERRLRARLEQEAPGQRVERFGELTYGIFVRGAAEEVEPWAIDLQNAMAGEAGALEGGISVGVAVRGPSHTDPERLRADATKALREAYETGTCTIVA